MRGSSFVPFGPVRQRSIIRPKTAIIIENDDDPAGWPPGLLSDRTEQEWIRV